MIINLGVEVCPWWPWLMMHAPSHHWIWAALILIVSLNFFYFIFWGIRLSPYLGLGVWIRNAPMDNCDHHTLPSLLFSKASGHSSWMSLSLLFILEWQDWWTPPTKKKTYNHIKTLRHGSWDGLNQPA